MSDYLQRLKTMEQGVVYSLSDHREMARNSVAEIEALRSKVAEFEAALKELMAIVEIHSTATGRKFAWAEMEQAMEALKHD